MSTTVNLQKHAIIDVGSNTIRTAIYGYNPEGKTAISLFSEREFTGIISYVKNNELCEAGIRQLAGVLKKMKELCDIANCESIHCFSTASLRDAENIELVRARVRLATGIEIFPLSAEEETFYDLAGLRSTGVPAEGTALDLGGGSCQIFHYDGNGLLEHTSVKLGVLQLSNRYVSGIFPTKYEAREIRGYAKSVLRDVKIPCVPVGGYVYAMGGTARAIARIHNALAGTMNPTDKTRVSRSDLADILQFAEDDPKRCIRMIARFAPARMHTLLPGILTMRAICKVVDAEGIEVVKHGIREGYLWSKVLNH